jgi:16S rRNA pseudouridine516 synthase
MTQRLDKVISRELNITRSEAKALIKAGEVSLDGVICKSGDVKVNESSEISVKGQALTAKEFVYIMLNKPEGVISASDGNGEKTVVDLVPDNMRRRGLFPAGRLDKDTTGFVLLTDDGAFAHDILSPSKHIDKTYIATLDKPVDGSVITDFEGGMLLSGEKLLKAEISIIDGNACKVRVVLRQGLYHQVKRMFLKHGITVLTLRRIKMGSLELDRSLKEGECRYITPEELQKIVS